MKEVWKRIVINGVKTNSYEISNLGNIRNIKTRRFLHGHLANNGYMMVHLRMEIQKYCSIHRLIMLTFKPLDDLELSRTLQINHKDGNKLNNTLDNLEWCTAKENIRHSFTHHLQKNESKPVYQYDLDGNFIKKWYNVYEAAQELNLTPTTLYLTAKCGKAQAYGFMWRYFYKEKLTPYSDYRAREVYMYDREKTKLIHVFSSQKEASKYIHCSESTMCRYCTTGEYKKNPKYYFTSTPLNI